MDFYATCICMEMSVGDLTYMHIMYELINSLTAEYKHAIIAPGVHWP